MISVCMATYNGERFIAEQLDTILAQISEHDELIVSDDGSSDKTQDIINSYKQKYNNIVLLQGPKKGVIKNFENAIKHARGNYIFLCDQDDIWVKNKVNIVLDCFKKTNAYVVLHDARIVDGNGNCVEESFYSHRGSKKGLLKNLWKNSYLGCCMAFDRKLLSDILPIPDKIEMHDWWIGMLGETKHKSVIIPYKLIDYRRHGNNVSSFHHHKFSKMVYNRVYLIKELIKRRVKKNG